HWPPAHDRAPRRRPCSRFLPAHRPGRNEAQEREQERERSHHRTNRGFVAMNEDAHQWTQVERARHVRNTNEARDKRSDDGAPALYAVQQYAPHDAISPPPWLARATLRPGP